MTQPKDGEIKSAITAKTAEEQLKEARQERTTLRGRQVKHNDLSPEEEARLKSVDKEIESLEKNLGIEGEKRVAEEVARQNRKNENE